MRDRAYNRKIFLSAVVFMLLVLLPGINPLYSQNQKAKLQASKQKIEKEIEYNNRLLNETKKTQKTTLNQLVILNQQISSREKLIQNINSQIKTVDDQIVLNNEILAELNNDLKNLKDEYAKMIFYAYKNRNSYDKLMFIFSSKDFNQAYKRIKYFQQYTAYRRNQAELIVKTENEINKTLKNLKVIKAEKVLLVQVAKEEKSNLSQEKSQQNRTFKKLNSKEKELKAAIRKKERAARKLEREIEKIIAEEIRLASEKSGTTETSGFALTPAELKLSNDFASNKGRLPWPVERGMISGTFGTHPHPVLKNVKIKNNGIDILTAKATKARAIFGGEVTRVISIPSYYYVVMVRHGEYLSVYSNLVDVFVKKGDMVTAKQEIGVIHTDIKDAKTELHFELWKGKSLLNPENWLAK
jgi:septal ring factor EnvC (AmiA/AmiB activator)